MVIDLWPLDICFVSHVLLQLFLISCIFSVETHIIDLEAPGPLGLLNFEIRFYLLDFQSLPFPSNSIHNYNSMSSECRWNRYHHQRSDYLKISQDLPIASESDKGSERLKLKLHILIPNHSFSPYFHTSLQWWQLALEEEHPIQPYH